MAPAWLKVVEHYSFSEYFWGGPIFFGFYVPLKLIFYCIFTNEFSENLKFGVLCKAFVFRKILKVFWNFHFSKFWRLPAPRRREFEVLCPKDSVFKNCPPPWEEVCPKLRFIWFFLLYDIVGNFRILFLSNFGGIDHFW